MKILFLAQRAPHLLSSVENSRLRHVLVRLAQRHDVTLATGGNNADDPQDAAALERPWHGTELFQLNPGSARLRGLASLLRGRSFLEGYLFRASVQPLIDQLMRRQKFDMVYVFSSPMAQYVKPYRGMPVVVDFVDVNSEKWSQLARLERFPSSRFFRLEAKRLAAFELSVSAWARRSIFVSEVEANLFRSRGGRGNLAALPNGVDGDLVRLPRRVEENDLAAGSRPAKLIFAGTTNGRLNADAALYFTRQVLPLILREYPRVTLDVVGCLPSRCVRKLGRAPRVRVVEQVADVRTHLIQADVSVAPLRMSRGIPNRVLEAMALSIPVVSTPEALEGIQVAAEEEVLVGASPEVFARQVIRLLCDHELRLRLARKARARVIQSYDWKIIGARLDKILTESIRDDGPHAARARGAGATDV